MSGHALIIPGPRRLSPGSRQQTSQRQPNALHFPEVRLRGTETVPNPEEEE